MSDTIDNTGPPYPPELSTDDEIGYSFKIGISQIGTVPPEFDVWETVISQYANSPIITALVTNFAEFIDQTQNFEMFYDLIMSVDTAVGYGLDVWGRIVGVNRIIKIYTTGPYFGFEEATDADGFNQAQFYSGAPLTSNYVLDDAAYRNLILIKAMANITTCSIPVLNRMLMTLFPHRGNAYVTENPHGGPWFGFEEATDAEGFGQAEFFNGVALTRMAMTYTFDFGLSPVELSIVRTSGVLPKPTGVKASVVINS